MSGAGTLESEQESGSEFRQKFEAIQAENQALRTVAATSIAERFEHVKPEDLTGVSIDQLATKAEEISAARAIEHRQVLESGLKGLGWSEEQIATALESNSAPAPVQPASQLEALGQIGGVPHRQEIDKSSMSPADKIVAGIAQKSKS